MTQKAGFSETFDLLEGSLTVHTSKQEPTAAGDEGADLDLLERSPKEVSPGGDRPTVSPGVYHKYVVGGGADAVLRCVVEPGHADFERLLMILNGLGEDGELEAMGDSVLLMAVISECLSHFPSPLVSSHLFCAFMQSLLVHVGKVY